MRNWKKLDEHEMRAWDWQPAPNVMVCTDLDTDLADIPGHADDVTRMVIIAAPIEGRWTAEMNVIYETDHDNVGTADGKTLEEACMSLCFDAATIDLFDRLHPLEFNCEDAVNRLAYEALALYENESPDGPWEWLEGRFIDDLDWFMGKAIDYIREHADKVGIEWEEGVWS